LTAYFAILDVFRNFETGIDERGKVFATVGARNQMFFKVHDLIFCHGNKKTVANILI
jgi:hypothetical protein